ncbi:MAG: hypothetical protein WAT21_13430 [Saprospiraceae bacterium]
MKNIIRISFAILLNLMFVHSNSAQSKITPKLKDAPLKGHDALLNKKMTKFKPEVHGYKFVNDIHWELPLFVVNGPVLAGACGGMAYSMLDYYHAGRTIPQQTYRPYNGSTLSKFIEARQKQSIISNVDKWAELINNPFGWRTSEFFNWGLQGFNGGRLQELRESIDAGKPAILGLFKAGGGGAVSHHQVIAIGYQLGRYKGDLGNNKEDLKIFICDPNFPNRTMTLIPDPARNCFHYLEDVRCEWMTYFVDKKYNRSVPPTIQSQVLSKDGTVHELLLEIYTGGDDLRGGSDNVQAIVNFKNGTSQKFENINRGARWIDHYYQVVPIELQKSVKCDQIKSVVLKTTFGGGIGGDNWNLNSFRVIAQEGPNQRELYNAAGDPLVRFDGNNRPFEASVVIR